MLTWATNIGYPGYANAAIDEVYQKSVINVMFAKAAQGVLSPEDAVNEAEFEMPAHLAEVARAKS